MNYQTWWLIGLTLVVIYHHIGFMVLARGCKKAFESTANAFEAIALKERMRK